MGKLGQFRADISTMPQLSVSSAPPVEPPRLMVRFENTASDSVAVTMFLARESPKLPRYVFAAGFSAGITSALTFVARINQVLTVELIMIAGALGVVVGTAFGYAWYRFLLRRLAKAATRNAGKDFTCSHELWLDDTGLVEATETKEHRTKYSAIQRVERTDCHVFIFTERARAYVIPTRAVDGLDPFVAELERRTSSRIGEG